MITDYSASFLILVFAVICAGTATLALICWTAAKIIEKERRDEGQHVGRFCRECEDFEPRIHKGYCYYQEKPCKAYDKACPLIKLRNEATKVR